MESLTLQVCCIFFKQNTVGGQSYLLNPRKGGQHTNEINASLPHQWFPAGDFDFSDTKGRCLSADFCDFFQRQDLFHRNPFNSMGHTVTASQIAAVCDGDTQVIDGSSVVILHRTKSPLFPPFFSQRWISLISIRLSTALHIS